MADGTSQPARLDADEVAVHSDASRGAFGLRLTRPGGPVLTHKGGATPQVALRP